MVPACQHSKANLITKCLAYRLYTAFLHAQKRTGESMNLLLNQINFVFCTKHPIYQYINDI